MPTLNERSSIVNVGSSGTTFVPGAWAQLIASAARDSKWSVLYMAPATFPSGINVFIDLAIGPPGSEVIILNDAYMQIGGSIDYNDSYQVLSLPLRFQAGDAISARIKDEQVFASTYHVMIRNFE